MSSTEDREESLFVGSNSDVEMEDAAGGEETVKIKTEPGLEESNHIRISSEESISRQGTAVSETSNVQNISSNTNSPEINNDDDDEIVQEFPVYFSTGLLNKLYLLQYPTRPAERPLVDANQRGILDSRIKLDSKLVEVDVPIETKKFYDTEKGEHWNSLNKQTFSGVAKPAEGEYMIGVFKDSELHLSSVSAVAQMRPQFQYITNRNAPDAQKEKEAAAAEEKSKKQPRAVQMTAMGSGENAPNLSGAITARKRMEDEDFVGMDWYDRDSDESWSISDKLMATRKAPLVSKTTLADYVEEISAPYIDPTAKKESWWINTIINIICVFLYTFMLVLFNRTRF